MFENRINMFTPNLGATQFTPGVMPMVRSGAEQSRLAMQVQVAAIYQAAAARAIEEHEIDKLFNPDFYDYQI